MHVMPEAIGDPVFKNLKNPFFGVDSRDFQLIQPNLDLLHDMGAQTGHPLQLVLVVVDGEPPTIGYVAAGDTDAATGCPTD